jgi:hypothetical protein
MVKVVEIDSQGRINLSRKAVLGGGDDTAAPAGNGAFKAATPPPPSDDEPAGAGRNGSPRGRGRRPRRD